MPDRNLITPDGRIAVVDVGSNSLRLAVFERLGATLLPLLNERVMCALGRGIAVTGRLNPDGVQLALANVERFTALARALAVDHLAIIATAAVRDAADGHDFAAELEERCGVPVRIINGREEARLSAAGILAGIPDADGVVGDLGGGSVELVRVDANKTPAIGAGVSLPLGPLRFVEFSDNRKAVIEQIERIIATAPLLRECVGKALYLVGGAWRAIARLHIEQTHYPLHIIHQYTIARRPAEAFLDVIAAQSRRSLERITGIGRRRLEVVPMAATILRRLIAFGKPDRLVFSAFGLREGYAYGLLPTRRAASGWRCASPTRCAAGRSICWIRCCSTAKTTRWSSNCRRPAVCLSARRCSAVSTPSAAPSASRPAPSAAAALRPCSRSRLAALGQRHQLDTVAAGGQPQPAMFQRQF